MSFWARPSRIQSGAGTCTARSSASHAPGSLRQDGFAEHDEGLHDLATDGVRALDGGRFEHGRVADHGAFHLERRDAIAARLHHVVVAALEPEVAVLVAHEHVARVIPVTAED